MSDVTIESLQLEVQASASQAVTSIDNLASTLGKLKNATKNLGLSGVSKQFSNLNSAVQSVDGSAADKVDKLANSLQKLSGLGTLKISSSVGNQIRNIGSAASSLSGVDFTAVEKLGTALQPLNSLGKATGLSSTLNQLKKLPELASTLNGINWATFTSQIQQLANALTPLANQLNTVSTAFNGLPTRIRSVVSATNSLSTSNNTASKSYINMWAKARMAYNVIRNGAMTIAKWITETNSYIESLNLFNASMGEYAEEAQRYANRVSEVMGIDPAEWMRNQGVFNTIINGFGVASDKAYLMSKNLTQLGYDLASFYNGSVEDAMQKLQSGISGELEPLRRLGYDLSVARLQQEAFNLGIDKSVSSMTQAEKSQLRYYAIMTQVTVAQGDMARTLNAPANQIRILKAEVTQCARALGEIFIPALSAVLPYAIAVARVIKILASTIASFFGFTLPEVDYSSISSGAGAIGDLADGADNAASGLGKAGKEAKKLKNHLLGIDELNIISNDDSSSGSGSGGSGSGLGLGAGDLGIELPEYDFLADVVKTKVDEIMEKLQPFIDWIQDHFKQILTLVTTIGAALLAWKLAKTFLDNLAWLQALKTAGLSVPLQIAAGLILTITGIAIEWQGIKDIIKNGIDGLNFAEVLGGALLTTGGAAVLGKGIANFILTAFSGSSVAAAIEAAGGASVGALFGAALGAIVAGIPMFFAGVWSAIKEGLNWLNGILITGGATLTGAGIGAMIGALGGPIGAGVGALIGLAVGLLTDFGIWLYQNWDDVKQTLKNAWKGISTWWTGTVIPAIKKMPEKIGEAVSAVGKWFSELPSKIGYGLGYALGSVVQWCTNVYQKLSTEIPKIMNKIGDWASDMIAKIKEEVPKVIDSIVQFFKELPNKLMQLGTDIWNGLVTGLQNAWDAFIQGIKDFIDGFVQGWKDALGIHSPSTVFAEIGGYVIEGFLNGITSGLKSISRWVKTKIIDPISKAIKKNPISDIVIGIKNTASDWWNKAKSWWSNVSDKGVTLEGAVTLAKQGWSTVKGWIGKIPIVQQAVALGKHLWTTVTDWVGKIPIVEQGVKLVKEKWDTVKNWIGNIPTLEQLIKLVKEKWSTVKEWIGNIPSLSQYIHLLKDKWTTVKNFVGNIPSLPQLIHLLKDKWTTVKNFVGNIPSLAQYIHLLKDKWTSVKNWVGNIPSLSQLIHLMKDKWSTVKNWIGNIPSLQQLISLAKNQWSTVQAWVKQHLGGAVSATINLAKGWAGTVGQWVKNQIGSAVTVTVNLYSEWKGKIKKFLGLSTGGIVEAGGGIKLFADGGFINGAMSGFWKNIPKYANGTANAGMHGSMFVAGENGAEMVGHINGQTEVLNRSQIHMAMKSAVISGMAQFTGYWRMLNNTMATSANAVIRSVLVSSDTMQAAYATANVGYDPSGSLAQSIYEDSRRAYENNFSDASLSKSMRDFYAEYVEPSVNRMIAGIEKQADKEEKTIVQVGNRTITDAVETQQKANGYKFTK